MDFAKEKLKSLKIIFPDQNLKKLIDIIRSGFPDDVNIEIGKGHMMYDSEEYFLDVLAHQDMERERANFELQNEIAMQGNRRDDHPLFNSTGNLQHHAGLIAGHSSNPVQPGVNIPLTAYAPNTAPIPSTVLISAIAPIPGTVATIAPCTIPNSAIALIPGATNAGSIPATTIALISGTSMVTATASTPFPSLITTNPSLPGLRPNTTVVQTTNSGSIPTTTIV